MKANDIITENTNLHLTHLEDLALFQGKSGAIKAINFLKNLSQLAKSSSAKKFNVTIKWDGSPALFCGIDPSDNKFFVGNKDYESLLIGGINGSDLMLQQTISEFDKIELLVNAL